MAYQGYLMKVGTYTVPFKYMKFDSYTVYRNVQDLDSYEDANGVLHRTVVSNVPNKVEWETPAMLTNTEFATLMSNIQAQYTVAKERKASVTLYIPETDSYITQDMYMPDPQPKIYSADKNGIRYEAITLKFIGY